mmetsp:Transcript_11478/g.42852  ORF Transcript_11478/g.42852 Transcript_11478/m.42852 type:complete len:993 (-) Transcript_11478:453-3431(-)
MSIASQRAREIIQDVSISELSLATARKGRDAESKTQNETSKDGRLRRRKLSSQTLEVGRHSKFSPWRLLQDFRRQKRMQLGEAVELVDRSRDILRQERNVIHVESPLTVVGDLHGQFFDLCTILLGADNRFLVEDGAKFLFLGDYVDRGAFGCEVMLLLCALKIQYPSEVHLIRGNHECASCTSHFGFQEECSRKYGDILYYRFVLLFQTMPLCATVNTHYGKMFAVHGGISPDLQDLRQIEELNRFVEPDNKGLLCDLLWADPVISDGLSATANTTEQDEVDWVPNPVRGCSYCFGYRPLDAFLSRNGFVCLLRAHEVQEIGFSTIKKGQMDALNAGYSHCIAKGTDLTSIPRLITIFSAPNYCDRYGNRGAILRIGENVTVEQYEASPHPEPAFVDSQADLWSQIIQKTCPYMPYTIHEFVQIAKKLCSTDAAGENEESSISEDILTTIFAGRRSDAGLAARSERRRADDSQSSSPQNQSSDFSEEMKIPSPRTAGELTEDARESVNGVTQGKRRQAWGPRYSGKTFSVLSRVETPSLMNDAKQSTRWPPSAAVGDEQQNGVPKQGALSDFGRIAARDAVNEMSPDAIMGQIAIYETDFSPEKKKNDAVAMDALRGDAAGGNHRRVANDLRRRTRSTGSSGAIQVGRSGISSTQDSYSTESYSSFPKQKEDSTKWSDVNPMITGRSKEAQASGRLTVQEIRTFFESMASSTERTSSVKIGDSDALKRGQKAAMEQSRASVGKGVGEISEPTAEENLQLKSKESQSTLADDFERGTSQRVEKGRKAAAERPISTGLASRVARLTREFRSNEERCNTTAIGPQQGRARLIDEEDDFLPLQNEDTEVVHINVDSIPPARMSSKEKLASLRARTSRSINYDQVAFTREEVLVIRFIFSLFDRDDDSYLSREELRGIAYESGELYLQEDELDTIVGAIDWDRDGRIGLLDFITLAARLKEMYYKASHASLMQEIQDLARTDIRASLKRTAQLPSC